MWVRTLPDQRRKGWVMYNDEDNNAVKTFVIVTPPNVNVFRMMHSEEMHIEAVDPFAEARYFISSIPFIDEMTNYELTRMTDGETTCYLNLYTLGDGSYYANLEVLVGNEVSGIVTWDTILEIHSGEKGWDEFVRGAGIEDAINEHRLGLL